MLNTKMQQALNQQINVEFSAAYFYLALAADFESLNLKGFAHWMRVQYQEERLHALKFFDFLHARNGQVLLRQVDAPHAGWKTPLEGFEHAYENEKVVSAMIDALVELAAQEHDHATHAFLQWFVNEQVEEEASTYQMVQKLKLVGDSSSGLLLLDRELAQRPPGRAAAPAKEPA